MSLKKKTLQGLIWTVADTFILRGSSFIASVYLARLLGPREFGIIGMISIFIAIGTSLVDSGLSSSLIRTNNADDQDFSTVFYLNLGLSAVVYLIIYLMAPFVAEFYNQPVLTGIMRLYCVSFVISAFSAVQLARLNAEMKFKKITTLGIPGTILGVLTGILLGYLGYGAWAIVWMYLVTQIVKSISLWLSSSWRPSLIFSRDKAKFHYGFGYKLMLSGLLNTSFKYIYNILIGKFYAADVLGYYERSRAFNEYPSSVLIGVVTRVTYPLLSKIQDDKEKIAIVYRKLLRIMFFITAPLMLGAAAIAEPLFSLVLGEEWLPAVPFFQILCLGYMFFPLHAFNLNVFKVYGRSDLFLKLEIIKKIVIVISVVITLQFGVIGLVWSSVFTSLFALFINTYYSGTMIAYSSVKQILDLLPTLFFAGLMSALVLGVNVLLAERGSLVQLLAGLAVGVVFYCLINYMFKTSPMMYALQIIKERKL